MAPSDSQHPEIGAVEEEGAGWGVGGRGTKQNKTNTEATQDRPLLDSDSRVTEGRLGGGRGSLWRKEAE